MAVGLQAFRIDGSGQIIDHDLQFRDETLQLSTGPQEIRERVLTYLLLYRNEWPYDYRVGIDYKTHRERPEAEYPLIRRDLAQDLRGIDGVLSIGEIDIELNREQRIMNITVEIDVEGGETFTLSTEI